MTTDDPQKNDELNATEQCNVLPQCLHYDITYQVRYVETPAQSIYHMKGITLRTTACNDLPWQNWDFNNFMESNRCRNICCTILFFNHGVKSNAKKLNFNPSHTIQFKYNYNLNLTDKMYIKLSWCIIEWTVTI